MSEWEKETAPVTIEALTTMCKDLVDARELKEKISEQLKSAQEAIDTIESKILLVMKENALPNFKGEFGSISIRNVKSISQPEDMQKKLLFFEYLKIQGVFEEMVSVNSRTLSSWANKEIEAREKAGVFGWVPPGLKAPETYASLSLRKK